MQQLIAEQIDIIVIGEKKEELMQLIMSQKTGTSYRREGKSANFTKPKEKEKQKERESDHTSKMGYLQMLSQLIGRESLVKENSKEIARILKSPPNKKMTKQILTSSFWLHLHFFVHDCRMLDPFAFQSTRGPVQICIIAGDQGSDLAQMRQYLTNTSGSGSLNTCTTPPTQNSAPTTTLPSTSIPTPQSNLQSNAQSNGRIHRQVKAETVVQSKILVKAHQMGVTGFASVLAVKITGENRIVEQNNNLRLTVRQLVRWIVEAHFQHCHRIKLKQKLGDEIANYQEQASQQFCSLI